MPLRRNVKLGVVPGKLIYGLNTAMFESRQQSPELTMGNDAQGVLTGAPTMEQAIGFHVTSSLTRGACRPC